MTTTLVEVLERASNISHQGYTFLNDRLEGREHSFDAMHREALRRARVLQSYGLKKGDRLAMIIPEGEDFVLTFFGAVMAGIVPVPMYPPLALGKLDAYVDAAARIMSSAGAKLLVTTKQVSPIVWSLVSRVDSLDDLLLTETLRDADATGLPEVNVTIAPSDPCFLQFTSGSTSDPKGVIVNHENLVANAKAIMVDGLESNCAYDRGVSWLPLYHDMGLIGFVIAPLMTKVPVVFIPTLSFVKRPQIWMEVVSKYRGTITFAPNFAFGLAAKRATPKRLAALDLSSLRIVGCGAEPINPATMRMFNDAFAPAGLNEQALMPCYGMAEATLAISFANIHKPFHAITINRDEYETHRIAVPYTGFDQSAALELVACGQTFPDHDVGIMNDAGELIGEGEVGEIVLRGPSVTKGYFENRDATNALLEGGWLHTGDLGFKLDGDLYISGRKKDLIILNGKNYDPHTFEWEVEHVEGIRKGNVVAFSRPGANSEELVIVAEIKKNVNPDGIAEAVKKRIHDAAGVRVRDVIIVASGTLPKTSSGKLQRRKTKQLYMTGSLGAEGNRTMGSTATKVALAKHVASGAVARVKNTIKKRTRLTSRRAESR